MSVKKWIKKRQRKTLMSQQKNTMNDGDHAVNEDPEQGALSRNDTIAGVDEVQVHITAIEREYQLKPSGDGSALEDYTEMVLQFGYVTFFAAAFPLCSLLALINNVAEIRFDGFRYLYIQKRNWYKIADGIGAWVPIIEFMSFFAILTNCVLLVLLAPVFEDKSAYERALYVFGIEHGFLALKVFMCWTIPGVSPATASAISEDAIRRENEEAAEENDIWEELGRDRDALKQALVDKQKLSNVPDGILLYRNEEGQIVGHRRDAEGQLIEEDPENVDIGDGMDRIPVGALYKYKYELKDGKAVKTTLTPHPPVGEWDGDNSDTDEDDDMDGIALEEKAGGDE